MKTHFADRLLEAVQQKQVPACVGLDPLVERFPAKLLREHHIATTEDGHIEPGTPGEKITAALGHFGREVLRTIAPLVPVVKINIAFFERYYADGIRVYGELVRCAHELGLLVIGDVKRADIGHSATQYAHAHLGEIPPWVGTGILNPDAVTVNPYFGFDAIRPFVEVGMGSGRGLFVLVQTSNESAPEIQDLALADGSTVSEHVARRVHAWSAEGDRLGVCGYSLIGAVVSPRRLPGAGLRGPGPDSGGRGPLFQARRHRGLGHRLALGYLRSCGCALPGPVRRRLGAVPGGGVRRVRRGLAGASRPISGGHPVARSTGPRRAGRVRRRPGASLAPSAGVPPFRCAGYWHAVSHRPARSGRRTCRCEKKT